MKKTRQNPNLAAEAVAPFLPYIVVGAVLYFYGGKIFAFVGSKVTGVPIEQYKKDVKTVTSASSSDLSDVASYIGNAALTAVGLGSSIDKKLLDQKKNKPTGKLPLSTAKPAGFDLKNKAMVSAELARRGYVANPATQAQATRNRQLLTLVYSWK